MAKKDFSKLHSFFTDNSNLQKDLEKKENKVLEQNQVSSSHSDIPDGYRPAYVEIKSKRVQLVFQPSIYQKAKANASKQGLSLNEYIHRLINSDIQ